jgi:membrane associated rhomboid family serine protease
VSTPAPQSEVDSEYCYRHPDRQSFIHCQRCGRTICPQCQTQAAVGVQCPECIREGRQQVAASRPGLLTRLIGTGSTPIVTYILIGLCVVTYAAQLVSGGALTSAWVLDPPQIASQPWRLITSAFLHSPGFIPHLLLNMYALFIFGPPLERFLGRLRYLALYLIGGLGGSLGVVLLYELWVISRGASSEWLGGMLDWGPTLGASGAIFALMGALLVLHKAMSLRLTQLLIVVAVNVAFGFFVPGIAWQDHLGGLGIGAAIAGVYVTTRRPQQRTRQVLSVIAIGAAVALILLACVISSPDHYR